MAPAPTDTAGFAPAAAQPLATKSSWTVMEFMCRVQMSKESAAFDVPW
jgi:hypothetical protein